MSTNKRCKYGASAEDFSHLEKRAKSMSIAQLQYAKDDARLAMETLDSQENNGDCKGALYYRDEMMVYLNELRNRGLK